MEASIREKHQSERSINQREASLKQHSPATPSGPLDVKHFRGNKPTVVFFIDSRRNDHDQNYFSVGKTPVLVVVMIFIVT